MQDSQAVAIAAEAKTTDQIFTCTVDPRISEHTWTKNLQKTDVCALDDLYLPNNPSIRINEVRI